MEAFGSASPGATSLLPLNIRRPWAHVRRRGKLFDLRPEMDCLVHQEGCKVKPNVDLAIRPEQELVQLAITKQQRLEAEVEARDCVDWLPSLLGSLYPYGIRPSQENRGPLADLVFLADDEQLLDRGAVVSMRHILSGRPARSENFQRPH